MDEWPKRLVCSVPGCTSTILAFHQKALDRNGWKCTGAEQRPVCPLHNGDDHGEALFRRIEALEERVVRLERALEDDCVPDIPDPEKF